MDQFFDLRISNTQRLIIMAALANSSNLELADGSLADKEEVRDLHGMLADGLLDTTHNTLNDLNG